MDIIENALKEGRTDLSEHESKLVLKSYRSRCPCGAAAMKVLCHPRQSNGNLDNFFGDLYNNKI